MKKSIPIIIMFVLIILTAFIYKESKDRRLEIASNLFSVNLPENVKLLDYTNESSFFSIKISISDDDLRTFKNSLAGYEVYSEDYRFPVENVKYGFYSFRVIKDKIYVRNIYIIKEHDGRTEIYMERCRYSYR